MNPRSVALRYQTAARAWLTLAALTLLLPTHARLGLWLPLHLALAGAASVAISGAMQNFVLALTATRSPGQGWVWTQFAAVNAGVLLIALGRPLDLPVLVAAGGTSFVLGAAILLWFVRHAWATSLNKRHRLPIQMYSLAVVAVIVGGAMGALMGSGLLHDPATYEATLHAHMTINVLGWVSLTIVGSLITLLPSTLRVRMPVWHGAWTASLLGAGVALLATGLAFDVSPVVAIGGACQLAGALGVAWMVSKVLSTGRRQSAPVSALHLVAGVCWFLIGSLALAVSAWHGVLGIDAFQPDFLAIFVLGWIVQVLLGAWSYLLPMGRPGDPNLRRTWLVAIEFAAWLQLGALNVGVGLIAASAAGWLGHSAKLIGVGFAAVGGGMALLKVWGFPALPGVLRPTPRAGAVWSPEET